MDMSETRLMKIEMPREEMITDSTVVPSGSRCIYQRIARWLELVVVFVVIPGLYALRLIPIPLFAAALLVGLICLIYLWRDRSFERKQLGNVPGMLGDLKRMLLVLPLGVAGLSLTMGFVTFAREAGWLEVPEQIQWFALPRFRPELWLMIMIFYPIVSVWPQELIYRAFFFQRYRSILPNNTAMIIVSGTVFGWAHVIFLNPWAVLLTWVGGLLFAWTYAKSRSLWAASLEHAIYGMLIFTIGLGWFFYYGSVTQGGN